METTEKAAKTKKSNQEFIVNECSCPVCQDILIKPLSPPCGHNLCQECYNSMKATGRSLKCPVCNGKLTNLNLTVNLILEKLIARFGGEAYKQRMKEYHIRKHQTDVIKQYLKSPRRNYLSSNLDDLLAKVNQINYEDTVAFLVAMPEKYAELEIALAFKNYYDQGKIMICRDQIMALDKFGHYFQTNFAQYDAEESINWLSHYAKYVNEASIMAGMTAKYSNRSDLYLKIVNPDNEMKLVELIDQNLIELKQPSKKGKKGISAEQAAAIAAGLNEIADRLDVDAEAAGEAEDDDDINEEDYDDYSYEVEEESMESYDDE